jgi:hypothetical protein
VIDEFTREALAIRVKRRLNSGLPPRGDPVSMLVHGEL